METRSCLCTLWVYLLWAHTGTCALNLSKQKLSNNQVFWIWVYLGNLIFKYRTKWEEEAHFRLWGQLGWCPLILLQPVSFLPGTEVPGSLGMTHGQRCDQMHTTFQVGLFPESLLLPDPRNVAEETSKRRSEIRIARFNNSNKKTIMYIYIHIYSIRVVKYIHCLHETQI